MSTVDLTDDATRAALTARLENSYAGRPVLLGPSILAAHTNTVARLVEQGCPVLVVATGTGAGPLPDPDTFTRVDIVLPPTASMTDEARVLDRVARTLPPEVVAAIEAFDPERRGRWLVPPFVTDDEPILGREVTGGRPVAWLALEDKMLADDVWDAAGVPRTPYRIVATESAALAAASEELAGPLGVVWSGDARDGVNGGGNFVRWVLDETDRAAAFAFFAPRCDRVRVMPFLDGVPCSIHGVVLPSGTAAFRPVELAILRDPTRRRFVYGGLSTWWDPPTADREAMRAAVRRVGAHLAAASGYRGAFGIDGVLTAEGFRPTELNTRASAGVTTVTAVDPAFFTALQHALVAGEDVDLTVADLEGVVRLMDAQRTGRPTAVGQGVAIGGTFTYPVAYDGTRLTRSEEPTGNEVIAADTSIGFFARVDPCAVLGVGERLAPLNVALLAHLDAEHDTGFGPLEAAPDLRS